MKSSQPNTNDHPPTESASSPRDNPCLGSAPNIAALDVFTDDGISYLLPYAQFLYAEKRSNPALEEEPDAPPEKILIHFASADVAILGSGLTRLAEGIQQQELRFVKSVDRRLAAAFKTHIAAITLTLIKETP